MLPAAKLIHSFQPRLVLHQVFGNRRGPGQLRGGGTQRLLQGPPLGPVERGVELHQFQRGWKSIGQGRKPVHEAFVQHPEIGGKHYAAGQRAPARRHHQHRAGEQFGQRRGVVVGSRLLAAVDGFQAHHHQIGHAAGGFGLHVVGQPAGQHPVAVANPAAVLAGELLVAQALDEATQA